MSEVTIHKPLKESNALIFDPDHPLADRGKGEGTEARVAVQPCPPSAMNLFSYYARRVMVKT